MGVKHLSVRAAVILVAGALLMLSGCSDDPFSTGPKPASASARPVVVAIGDSIMKGHGLPPSQAWPAVLAVSNNWNLTNLACDGAGFVAKGDDNDCGSAFADLVDDAVATHPELVLISGSSNDLGVDNAQLSSETASVISSLRAKLPTTTILAISTVWNDTAEPDQMADINEQVRTATLAVHGTYIDIGQPLAGHRSWLQADRVHPTERGQKELAKAVAKAIREAKLGM